MTKRQTPPARKSCELVVVVKPFGPHHCARCFGSVKAENPRSRGASSTRVPTMQSGSLRSMLFLSATFLLLGLQRLQIIVETIEPLLPEPAIFVEPVVRLLERGRFDLARPHLRIAGARDQPGALKHLEMLGDGGQTHLEWRGQFRHRGFPEREAGQDGAAGGGGERRERGAEAV